VPRGVGHGSSGFYGVPMVSKWVGEREVILLEVGRDGGHNGNRHRDEQQGL
jgi:hypothetical protein